VAAVVVLALIGLRCRSAGRKLAHRSQRRRFVLSARARNQFADTHVASGATTSLATTTTAHSRTTTTAASTTKATTSTAPMTTAKPATSVEYRNTQYGFTFSLPADWKGIRSWTEKWQGFPINTGNASSSTTSAGVYGPELLIRNPLWTAKNPRQDIPIMVFTIAQWDSVQQMKLSVGGAPIAPSELGHNATYVFALPARYNYAFQTGYQEVETVLAGKPLQGF